MNSFELVPCGLAIYLLRLADFVTVILSSLMKAVCVAENLKTFKTLTD